MRINKVSLIWIILHCGINFNRLWWLFINRFLPIRQKQTREVWGFGWDFVQETEQPAGCTGWGCWLEEHSWNQPGFSVPYTLVRRLHLPTLTRSSPNALLSRPSRTTTWPCYLWVSVLFFKSPLNSELQVPLPNWRGSGVRELNTNHISSSQCWGYKILHFLIFIKNLISLKIEG